MSAIEKLQMLIEAAEYLDRRERGKATYVCLCDIRTHVGMQMNPNSVAMALAC